MTEAEQLLIAAADLTQKSRIAKDLGRPVELDAEFVAVVAYFVETCGRAAARAGSINATGASQWLIEHAHDLARTHLGDST